MSNTKKRINLTLDSKTYKKITILSKQVDQKPATLSLNIIQEYLELKEDKYFSKQADKRLNKKHKRIPHNKIWE